MSLRKFLMSHRDEVIAACKAELDAGGSLWALEREAVDFVRSMAGSGVVAPRAERSEEPLPSPSLSDIRIVGGSPAMTRVRTAIDQLSRRSRTPVLIVGAVGCGKRHCARALHEATYPDGDFLELDRPERLAKVELKLGALRSFSSAQSQAGLTVYVHDLPEAAAEIQAQVGKLFSEPSLQFRLVVSSSQSLARAARAERVRPDLAFRFSSELQLPPLRERAEDIPELVQHFAALAAFRSHAPAPTVFCESALARLSAHAWPGNLTELANCIERVSIERGAVQVEGKDLSDLGEREPGVTFDLPANGIDLVEVERQLLTQALAMADNNQTRAASMLGLTRDQLRYRLGKFDLFTVRARGA